jgi:undecaprenyl-diphosphatase
MTVNEYLMLWINQGWANPLLDGLFWWLSQRIWFALPLGLVFAAFTIHRIGSSGWRLLLALTLTIAIGDSMGNLLKGWLAEARPCFDMYLQLRAVGGIVKQCGEVLTGMPSNHALNFFTAATFIAFATPWRNWKKVLFVTAILVALSRIYLGKHYPSQVVFGAALGYLWAYGAVLIARRCNMVLPFATPNRMPHAV